MKNNELIDFLEEKYMDNDTINVILKHDSIHNTNSIKIINDIYDIFNFIGLNNDYIEVLIRKTLVFLIAQKVY